jgi:hypothetical protein
MDRQLGSTRSRYFESVLLISARKLEGTAYVKNPQSFQEMKESIPRETAYLQDKIKFFTKFTRPAWRLEIETSETLQRKNGFETPRTRGVPNVTELPRQLPCSGK